MGKFLVQKSKLGGQPHPGREQWETRPGILPPFADGYPRS